MKSVCNLGHVESEMRKIFSIPSEVETRVWTKYMSNTYDLFNNMEHTLTDAGLYCKQVHMSIKTDIK